MVCWSVYLCPLYVVDSPAARDTSAVYPSQFGIDIANDSLTVTIYYVCNARRCSCSIQIHNSDRHNYRNHATNRSKRREEQNRTGIRGMSCVSYVRAKFKSKKGKTYLPKDLPDDFNMRTRKQTCSTSIASPEPIVVDILCLGDMRTAREHKLVFNFFFRVPGPQSVDDKPDTTVRREPSEGRDTLDGSRGSTGMAWIRGIRSRDCASACTNRGDRPTA